jgi:hypothetical protein
MNNQSNLVIVLAMASLIAACGGGGGNERDSGGNDGGTNLPTTQPPTYNPSPNPGPGPVEPIPATDQQLRGHLSVVGNQVVFINGDRTPGWPGASEPYNGATIKYFEENGLHIASGGTEADRTKQIPPSTIAPAAPIASFGIRISTGVLNDETDHPETGAQKVIGRVAMNFVEVESAGGVPAGQQPERVTFIIDNVELETNDQGRLISAKALEDAKLFFAGEAANGTTVTTDYPVPADSVRLMPLNQLIDNYGDTSSHILLVDLEQAFSQAGSELSAFHNLDGQFNMHLTFSSAKIIRPEHANADEGPRPRRELVGQSIQLPGHTAVNGGGVSGLVLIRRVPN